MAHTARRNKPAPAKAILFTITYIYCILRLERRDALDYSSIFGSDGLLQSVMPDYEYRPSQVRMANRVSRAFKDQKNLIIEAGTGTGKTLAYLLPAIELKQRIIISTGTKNLQEQIFYKDIPFAREKLDYDFEPVIIKGRGNYLCIRKLPASQHMGLFTGKREIDLYNRVLEWSRETETGDIAEAGNLPEKLPFWQEINARKETCLGSKCPYFNSCFITKLRRKASKADIIVVNHYLLFADRAVRKGGYGEVLPEYKYLILDEAHLIESIAANYFGNRLSSYQIKEIGTDIRKEARKSDVKSENLNEKLSDVEYNSESFFNEFSTIKDKMRIDGLKQSRKIREKSNLLSSSIADLSSVLQGLAKKKEDLEPLLYRSYDLNEQLKMIMEENRDDHVYWAEQRRWLVSINRTPLIVSDLLKENLFDHLNSAVLTSATLTVAGRFDFLMNRVGLQNANTAIMPSEFDYRSKALLYIPTDMPLPSEENFYEEMSARVQEILKITGGRAFVLFTSFSGMERTYENLRSQNEFNLLVQGESSKGDLIDRFKKGKRMVLLATMSFWQGVDVQGEDLSCVIIDKLPFSVPTEPVVSATIEYIKSEGGKPFVSYQLPVAVTMLKQGLGRLIRHKNDYGIAAVMDKRLLTRRYGQVFLKSLPPYRSCSNIRELANLYRRLVS